MRCPGRGFRRVNKANKTRPTTTNKHAELGGAKRCGLVERRSEFLQGSSSLWSSHTHTFTHTVLHPYALGGHVVGSRRAATSPLHPAGQMLRALGREWNRGRARDERVSKRDDFRSKGPDEEDEKNTTRSVRCRKGVRARANARARSKFVCTRSGRGPNTGKQAHPKGVSGG